MSFFNFLPRGAISKAPYIVAVPGGAGVVGIIRLTERRFDARLGAQDRDGEVLVEPLARPAGGGGGRVDDDDDAVRGYST